MIIDAEFEEVEGEGNDGAEGISASDELDLSASDSLPWLEAEEEDDAAGSVDTAQIIGFGVILLALLIGIVGAIYLVANRGAGSEIVADGSTIEAPEGPIKQRPEDPGGKEFAGTGNMAPAVGEGQTREGQIGEERDTETGAASSEDGGTAPSQPAPAAGGAYVQLAAYGSRDRAEEGWQDLSRQTGALSGKRYRIEQAEVGGATVYRLQVVAADRSSANSLCSAIKADGLDCAVK